MCKAARHPPVAHFWWMTATPYPPYTGYTGLIFPRRPDFAIFSKVIATHIAAFTTTVNTAWRTLYHWRIPSKWAYASIIRRILFIDNHSQQEVKLTYQLQFTDIALANLNKYSVKDQSLILGKIEQLADHPLQNSNVKRLVEFDVSYRLRAGNYRIFF